MSKQEKCDSCHSAYVITRVNARLYVFLDHLECSHIAATCTSCKNVETIFIAPQSIVGVANECKLRMTVITYAPDNLQQRALRAWGLRQASQEPEPVIEPPRDWVRSLYDDLRTFGGE